MVSFGEPWPEACKIDFLKQTSHFNCNIVLSCSTVAISSLLSRITSQISIVNLYIDFTGYYEIIDIFCKCFTAR